MISDDESRLISVVVPTRDRGDLVVRAIRTILASGDGAREIIVVDQSTDERTEIAMAEVRSQASVRYIRDEARGLSRALNTGIAVARGEIVAITGDDCEVSGDWLKRIREAFAADERIGVVFGNVESGPHDPTLGFVPGYMREQPRVIRKASSKHRIGGTSSCMALRRPVWERLHGFDPVLGVGAELCAAEETDFVIRALQAGHSVLEDPTIRVTHHGFRPWSELGEVIERDWFGTGAAVAKLLRRSPATATALLLGLSWNLLAENSGVIATLGGRPHRRLRAAAFARGLRVGLSREVDPVTDHFV